MFDAFGWSSQPSNNTTAHLSNLLTNDSLHAISAFELNQIASLTYGEDVCDDVFEILEEIQRKPMEYTPLTVQKSLIVSKHVLVYGSEKCVNSANALIRHVDILREFNTVLWAQQLNSTARMMYRIKGGGVDKGGPVRESAKDLYALLIDTEKLRTVRNQNADPNSLVPIGDTKVAFVSDEVRFYLLKKKINEQAKVQLKSNLASETGGFGSGYNSKDGKSIVGAAHGLEEMIAQAAKANAKFSDDGTTNDYKIPALLEVDHIERGRSAPPATVGTMANSAEKAAPIGDLLDFSAGSTLEAAQPVDFFSGNNDLLSSGGEADLLGFTFVQSAKETTSSSLYDSDLLEPAPQSASLLSSVDPFAAVANEKQSNLDVMSPSAVNVDEWQPVQATHASAEDTYNAFAVAPDVAGEANDPVPQSIMASSDVLRFSALDDLVPAASIQGSTIQAAKDAEQRLLGFSSNTMASPDAHTATFQQPVMESPPNPLYSGVVANLQSLSISADDHNSQGHVHTHIQDPVAPSTTNEVIPTLPVEHDDEEENGFMMGGNAGSGLAVFGPPPSAPPPPPPSVPPPPPPC